MSLLELFCDIDNFWQENELFWHQTLLEIEQRHRNRARHVSVREPTTIEIHFLQRRFRDSKQLLEDHDLYLVTKLHTNMKNRLLEEMDKFFLCNRAMLETIFDQLKNISQIQHTGYRTLLAIYWAARLFTVTSRRNRL